MPANNETTINTSADGSRTLPMVPRVSISRPSAMSSSSRRSSTVTILGGNSRNPSEDEDDSGVFISSRPVNFNPPSMNGNFRRRRSSVMTVSTTIAASCFSIASSSSSGDEEDSPLASGERPGTTRHGDNKSLRGEELVSTAVATVASNEAPLASATNVLIPRGFKLRDEFVCPITRELMVDPVIAADGHTYDRIAIEQWLQSHATSPKTGQPLEQLALIPNHNLMRLLRDMFREGGQPLYCADADDVPGPQLALVSEKVLHCKCLGPVESDWNRRTFRVTSVGAIGGRRRPIESSAAAAQSQGDVVPKEFVQFGDATVSRKHFNIRWDADKKLFAIQDLGSAGGTFVRIPPWKPMELQPGMRLMVGKHQLEVCQASESTAKSTNKLAPAKAAVKAEEKEDNGNNDDDNEEREDLALTSRSESLEQPATSSRFSRRKHPQNVLEPSSLNTCNATAVLEDAVALTEVNTPKYSDISAVMQGFDFCGVASHAALEAVTSAGCSKEENENQAPADTLFIVEADDVDVKSQTSWTGSSVEGVGAKDDQLMASSGSDIDEEKDGLASMQGSQTSEMENACAYAYLQDFTRSETAPRGDEDRSTQEDPLLVLRCYAPEGTPIQGREYSIGKSGATLGRKAQNTISFSHSVGDSTVGIDNSISGEHANIQYNQESGRLELRDGNKGSRIGSTNGTWIRLSAMHKKSEWHYLQDHTEILVGTVRFLVSMDEAVVERNV